MKFFFKVLGMGFLVKDMMSGVCFAVRLIPWWCHRLIQWADFVAQSFIGFRAIIWIF